MTEDERDELEAIADHAGWIRGYHEGVESGHRTGVAEGVRRAIMGLRGLDVRVNGERISDRTMKRIGKELSDAFSVGLL